MKLRHAVFGVVAAALLPSSTGAEDGKGGGPVVTVKHPPAVSMMGGQPERRVDCGTLVRQEQKLWLTCEFAQQVDSNGQQICTNTSNLPSDPAARKAELSFALYQALAHFARVHKDCVAQAGAVDAQLGKDPASIHGQDWRSRTSCSLIRARNSCDAALDNDNP